MHHNIPNTTKLLGRAIHLINTIYALKVKGAEFKSSASTPLTILYALVDIIS